LKIYKEMISKTLVRQELVTLFGFLIIQMDKEQTIKKSITNFEELH
jgi:hypothetical protein